MSNVNKLMTLREIEREFGYARGSLTSLRAKGYMPEPDYTFGVTPVWGEKKIKEWAKARRRVVSK